MVAVRRRLVRGLGCGGGGWVGTAGSGQHSHNPFTLPSPQPPTAPPIPTPTSPKTPQHPHTQGDIYKASYSGWYCVDCEEYKDDKELMTHEAHEHCCPTHRKPCQHREEVRSRTPPLLPPPPRAAACGTARFVRGRLFRRSLDGWRSPPSPRFSRPFPPVILTLPLPNRLTPPPQENYFFALSKYQDQLAQLIEGSDFVQPAARRWGRALPPASHPPHNPH